MRLFALTFASLISFSCLAQYDYKSVLTSRVKEISELDQVSTSLAMADGYYSGTRTEWSPDLPFYEDDIISYRGCAFRALADSKGKDPFTSPQEWTLHHGIHPYYFLRDTALIQDLRMLLHSENVYVRIYAVAALAKKQDNLYSYVRSQLGDTTQVDQWWSDTGWTVCPGDLMLWFTMDRFTSEQKDELKRAIIKDYRHLYAIEAVLMYHKGHPDDYSIIKEIVREGSMGDFGLIALAKYCRPEDFETIRTGFSHEGKYIKGSPEFPKAIEYCPNLGFKEDLLKRGLVTEHEIRALAALKDVDCLKKLKTIARDTRHSFRYNQAYVYYALKKHYHPMYDELIAELEKTYAEEDWERYNRPHRWDY